jgi:hypothetical protein
VVEVKGLNRILEKAKILVSGAAALVKTIKLAQRNVNGVMDVCFVVKLGGNATYLLEEPEAVAVVSSRGIGGLSLEMRLENGVTLPMNDKEQCMQIALQVLSLTEISLHLFVKQLDVEGSNNAIGACSDRTVTRARDDWGFWRGRKKTSDFGRARKSGASIEL